MNPDNYIYVAEKLVEAVLQMEQLIDRLLILIIWEIRTSPSFH